METPTTKPGNPDAGVPVGRLKSMWRRRVARVLIIATMVTGTAFATATPALASVGGCEDSNPTVTACVNFGDSGNNLRADFYFKKPPDSSYWTYYVWTYVNGYGQMMASGHIDHSGRYCCWYRATDSLPNIRYSAYTVVSIYTQWGSYHTGSISPTIVYWN